MKILHCIFNIFRNMKYNFVFISLDDLWDLVQLSGVPINREVSKIVNRPNSEIVSNMFSFLCA